MQIPTHHPITSPFASLSASESAAANQSAATPSTSSSSSSTSSASITANDFLELLVTEMKNQDPTANTDPNEYINQLVQVNSLEQLIQINQDLGGAGSSTSGSTTSVSTTAAATGSVTQGNLSANTSGHSNIAAAAGQVANAMESRPNVPAENASSQLSNRLPSNFLQSVEAAVKP